MATYRFDLLQDLVCFCFRLDVGIVHFAHACCVLGESVIDQYAPFPVTVARPKSCHMLPLTSIEEPSLVILENIALGLTLVRSSPLPGSYRH